MRLKAIRDGNATNEKAFGFPSIALIIDFKGIYLSGFCLIIKHYNEKEKDIMVNAIASLSKEYNLFLVDHAMSSVVDSKDKLCIGQYLNYEN
jgi:hypothetical protein